MFYGLLAGLLPIRLVALVVLVAVGLQFGGVDIIGFLTVELVDPLLSWLAQEFSSNLWPW
ncbi:hypothetical protein [Salinigranum halophilum]|uniref:hypothetical protein n=1 Tax=Salinigranum halophilum TaxID=2565931 RepID=UPI00115D554B|nr:hypothetical protein [Salinigranum halophilum]